MRKIYIIDDDMNSVQRIQAILKKKGYQCIKGFTSPTESFDLTQKEPPDLVIPDIIMPEMNRFELTEKIKK